VAASEGLGACAPGAVLGASRAKLDAVQAELTELKRHRDQSVADCQVRLPKFPFQVPLDLMMLGFAG